jgi:hypothetical protein
MFSGEKLLFSYIMGHKMFRFSDSFFSCRSWRPCVVVAGIFTYFAAQLDILGFIYRTVILFYILSEYRNIEYRTGEFNKLSINYRMSDQGLNLSDYRISDSAKTIGCLALERKTKNLYNWYQRMVKRLILASSRSDNSDSFLLCWRDRALTPVPYTPD